MALEVFYSYNELGFMQQESGIGILKCPVHQNDRSALPQDVDQWHEHERVMRYKYNYPGPHMDTRF
jgi:hypothetical protein